MSITKKQSKNKSSRLKADFFEISVAIELADHYDASKSKLEKERGKLLADLKKLADGKEKILEQKERAILASKAVIKELAASPLRKKVPSEVLWVGRGWQNRNSLSDVDIHFKSGKSLGISLKSTRAGKGTQKNIGAKKLKTYLGLDVSVEIENMWLAIRKQLREEGGRIAELADTSKTTIRKNKYKFPKIQSIGEKYGRSIQKIGTIKSVNLFNKLPHEKKVEFLSLIFGANETKPLLNVLAEGGKIHIGWNNPPDYSSEKDVKAVADKKDEKLGYSIFVNRRPIIRIQTNFTNGIGLSAFCERAFLP